MNQFKSLKKEQENKMIGYTRVYKYNGKTIMKTESRSLLMLSDKKMCKSGMVKIGSEWYIPKSVTYYKNNTRISKVKFKNEIKATFGSSHYDPIIYKTVVALKKAN